MPYHKAKRIVAAIRMSLRVDGRAPTIILDEKTGKSVTLDNVTKKVLNEFDAVDSKTPEADRINNFWNPPDDIVTKRKCFDLEDVPLFREHKIIQLEELLSRAIATKYKISLFKGM